MRSIRVVIVVTVTMS